jgi:protein-disulfide isomerase
MTESFPSDADAPPAADPTAPAFADEPPAADPTESPLATDAPQALDATESSPLEAVPTEPVLPVGARSAAPRTGRGPAVLLGYVAAALAGALLLVGGLAASGGLARPIPSPSPTPTATPSPPPNAAIGPSLGSAAAPVTVEIWADYQCPYCRLEAMVFGGSLERAFVLPGIARVVYRDFAFLGQESTDAAVAARCAGRQDPGAYWRYHDLLFASQNGENQGTFKRQNLLTLAGLAALDATAFTACLDDPAVARAVTDETAAGRALGVESTPTMRVSGPGGLKTLAGFSSGWSAIRDAITAVSVPAPSVVPSVGASPGASPGASSSPTPPAAPAASPSP